MGLPIRIPIDQYLTQQAARMDFLYREVASGNITVRQWRDEMAVMIRRTHNAAGIIARDGQQAPALQRVTLWAQRQVHIARDTRRLNRWVRQIERGELSNASLLGQLRARARLYANSARQTWGEVRHTVALAIGMTEKRRVLGASEQSCNTCPAQAALGWVDINSTAVTGVADGTTDCGPGCNCRIEYR